MISEYAKQDIEKLRCKSLLYKRINIVVYAVSFLVVFVLWIKLKVMGEDGVDYVQFLIFLTFAIAISTHVAGEKYVQVMRDFKSAYKTQFVVEILYEQFGNVDYIGIHGFSERVIQDFQLVHLANHMYSEDYLRAVYNGVIFEQSDVVIIEKERKEFPSVFFKGRMLKLSHSKEPVEDIRIFTRNFEHRVINNTIQYEMEEQRIIADADEIKLLIDALNGAA